MGVLDGYDQHELMIQTLKNHNLRIPDQGSHLFHGSSLPVSQLCTGSSGSFRVEWVVSFNGLRTVPIQSGIHKIKRS
jgi:hypothetical protein